MGWSCTQAASETMERWTAFCRKNTGSQNTYAVDGVSYFIETSSREYRDGAITGSIMRVLPNGACRRSASFRINGDGTIANAPTVLRGAP